MSFDYFYGQQSELFTFYRVPKVLFTNERFWNISADAKMLYGILLDRMSLSAKNGWIDKNGRVYIIFTIDEAKMALNCAEQKAIKLLSELEKKAGLIERKRQGLDAIKHHGERTDLTSAQLGQKSWAVNQVAEQSGDSRVQVQRYIRLTELIPELLDMVDTGQIKFNPAVELSYLASEEQQDFLSAMDYAQAAPSLSQAQRIKKLAQEGECTLDAMCEIMNEIKKGELDRVTFKTDSLRKYFPKSYTNKQMEDKIIQLLEQWQKKREKSMER